MLETTLDPPITEIFEAIIFQNNEVPHYSRQVRHYLNNNYPSCWIDPPLLQIVIFVKFASLLAIRPRTINIYINIDVGVRKAVLMSRSSRQLFQASCQLNSAFFLNL